MSQGGILNVFDITQTTTGNSLYMIVDYPVMEVSFPHLLSLLAVMGKPEEVTWRE